MKWVSYWAGALLKFGCVCIMCFGQTIYSVFPGQESWNSRQLPVVFPTRNGCAIESDTIKTQMPEQLKADLPQSRWGKILAATRVAATLPS